MTIGIVSHLQGDNLVSLLFTYFFVFLSSINVNIHIIMPPPHIVGAQMH